MSFLKWHALALPMIACLVHVGAHSRDFDPADPDFKSHRSFYMQTEKYKRGNVVEAIGVSRLVVAQWARMENGRPITKWSRDIDGTPWWIASVPHRNRPREQLFPFEGTALMFTREMSRGDGAIKQGDDMLPFQNLRLALCAAGAAPLIEECWTPASGTSSIQASWLRYEPHIGAFTPGALAEKSAQAWKEQVVMLTFKGVSPETVSQTFLAEAAVARAQREQIELSAKREREAKTAEFDRIEKLKADQLANLLKTSPRRTTAFCSTGTFLEPAGRMLSEMMFYCDITGKNQPMNVKRFLESGWSLLTQNRTLSEGYSGPGYIVEVSFQKQ